MIASTISCTVCGNDNCTVSNPSHPTVYECNDCRNQWNPDNEQAPFLCLIETFKENGFSAGKGYISRGGKNLTANPAFAMLFPCKRDITPALTIITQLIKDKEVGWDDVDTFKNMTIQQRRSYMIEFAEVR